MSHRRERISRDRILRLLGYPSYRAYINGKIWAEIRSRVLAKYPDCYCCFEPAIQVHHTKYAPAVLSGESLRGLLSVCWDCHMQAHRYAACLPKKRSVAASQWLRQHRKDCDAHTSMDIEAMNRIRRAS